MNLPQSLRLKLIDSVLRKPVPRSGVVRIGSGAELVDAKIIRFMKNDEPWLIVEDRDGDQLVCSTWNGETHTGKTRYPIAQFTDKQYKIKHYYGVCTIYYDGLLEYARGYYLRLVYVSIHIRLAFQRVGTFYTIEGA